jgi:mxaA protein
MQPNSNEFTYKLTSAIAFICAIFCLLLSATNAFAEKTLPSIDEKYISIKEVNPTRDSGYVVGDILNRTVILEIKKPYELIKESLPIIGYEHRWRGQVSGIELIKINTESKEHSNSVSHEIDLSYQVFTTSRTAKPAILRGEVVKIRNTTNKDVVQYRIPSFNFRVSPLSVYGQVVLKDEMSPFLPPLQLDSSKEMLYLRILIGALALSLLGLLYILGVHAWLPKMGAPFAKAYRDIRKMPNDSTSLKQAVSRVHQSINTTAGASVFSHSIDDFLKAKPAFTPMKKELESFFSFSREVFFESGNSTVTKEWLLSLCRKLRDCERGLKPNMGA